MSECYDGSKIKSPKRRHGISISWRLFAMLVAFVAVMLCVIWIFQVALLNKFYQHSKIEEFSMTKEAILSSIETEDPDELDRTVAKYSYKFDSCICIYQITQKNEAQTISDSHINGTCLLHHLSGEALSQLYCNAVDNEGEYVKKWVPKDADDNAAVNTIFVSAYSNDSGNRYCIMINSELQPLNATVLTLEKQFGWIACLLTLGALILAAIIAKTVCAPLEQMGESAKRLAHGDYSADFGGGAYREAQELADALNYASCELKKNDVLQKELVANISHDLRTPLTLIKGYGEVMIDIPDENTPENIKIIIDETERLTELVNDMLDLSKIKAGTRKPEKEVFNITQTTRDVMKRYSKLKENDGYDISFNAEEDVYIFADRTMMLQVVYNLVNNAINYTGADKHVAVLQSVHDRRVRISVSDSGSGISPEDLPYIWDRYYKVDKVHRRAQIGTGLGLSIVKGILESHSACYGVESKIGAGSVFWFEMDICNDMETDGGYEAYEKDRRSEI